MNLREIYFDNGKALVLRLGGGSASDSSDILANKDKSVLMKPVPVQFRHCVIVS
jgi:hypothetical protein